MSFPAQELEDQCDPAHWVPARHGKHAALEHFVVYLGCSHENEKADEIPSERWAHVWPVAESETDVGLVVGSEVAVAYAWVAPHPQT